MSHDQNSNSGSTSRLNSSEKEVTALPREWEVIDGRVVFSFNFCSEHIFMSYNVYSEVQINFS